ncbi:hypothetical protein BD310DRAFT_923780 [Dichomitus squalens]|uniref:Uncharacterized protein n=1 Tax=Dichomitus squalens TaxID=114155 RepID=A0A4Q9PZL0_9APHY|nr:hypothetical protein BD310DRAFT_923780 [Dichomitus squalens]
MGSSSGSLAIASLSSSLRSRRRIYDFLRPIQQHANDGGAPLVTYSAAATCSRWRSSPPARTTDGWSTIPG